MAYDGYRSPSAEQPSFFDLNDERLGQPMQQTHSNQSHNNQSPVEYERVRPQPSAAAKPREPGFAQAQQPINDAVTSAFDKADTTNAISPELLNQITSQITANVIQQLKTTNLNAQVNADHTAPAPNAAAAVVPPSPSTQPATSPTIAHRNVYTPPSPHRPEEDVSPPSSFTQAKYSHPAHGHSPPIRPAPSPSSQASHASEIVHRDIKNECDLRPKGPIRLGTGENATLVEKAWGQLYDENGLPTARLGQFLRGIANHLIENYEPKNSLVVTPAKMQQFYKDTALAGETYPWHVVFDDRTSSISRLYREVGAVHHLVQEDDKYDERPDIPGLTPQGFQTWMSLSFLANPDHEFERLLKVVREMPISNADDRKDRFPKDISRRLFPAQREAAVKDKIEKAMVTHCNIKLPAKGHKEPEVTQVERKLEQKASYTEPMSSSTGGLERERQPYSATPSVATSVTDEEEDMPTPQPIERERKPYSSQPGTGKNFEDLNKPTTLPPPVASASMLNKSAVPPTQASVPDSKEPTTTRSRAYSTAANRYEPVQHPPSSASGHKSRPIPIVSNGNRPTGGLPPSSYDTNGNPAADHLHPRQGNINRTRSTRNRSPSVNDAYRNSEPSFGAPSQSGGYAEPRERERDYERGASFRDDPSRMSMYEMGSSIPGRDRSRYRYEGGGSVSSGAGNAMPPPPSYHPSVGGSGRDHYSSDEERYRAGAGRVPPLGGTPGSGYEQYGASPNNYYR